MACPIFSVQEAKLDFDKTNPWIWFRRASTLQERALNGSLINAFETTFDVEVVGEDIDCVQQETDAIKTALQEVQPGSYLEDTFQTGIFVLEHSDEYLARTILDTDTGFHIATFSVKIFHCA